MPVPELAEDDESRLSELQKDLVGRVYDQWKNFEQPLQYNIASGSYNKRAKKAGITMQTLIDSVEQMGYINKIQTKRGGYFLLPYGIFKRLPVYKRDVWRNPTKLKRESEAKLDYGRKIRLLKEERDVPLYDELGDPILLPKASPEAPAPTIRTQPPVEKSELTDAIKSILKAQPSTLEATKKEEQ